LSSGALVIAVKYLLLVVLGGVGALLLLVWLFRETSGRITTRRETTKISRDVKFRKQSRPSASDEIEPARQRAA
jgi:hypothetical protein